MTLPAVEIIYCHQCHEKTRWVLGRGGRFSRCDLCGTRFPCAHPCSHLDCADCRREQGKAQRVSGSGNAEGAPEHDKLAPRAPSMGSYPANRIGDEAGSAKENATVAVSETQSEGDPTCP